MIQGRVLLESSEQKPGMLLNICNRQDSSKRNDLVYNVSVPRLRNPILRMPDGFKVDTRYCAVLDFPSSSNSFLPTIRRPPKNNYG